ncbi:hypothetical protein COO60DRAFT_1235447 [Scenedesmus sp. NREL 46B-D3]|nr:hypothetical protein COO60DRAFT_1235447 [Scenedesmus sp. NREL 46B-D3]
MVAAAAAVAAAVAATRVGPVLRCWLCCWSGLVWCWQMHWRRRQQRQAARRQSFVHGVPLPTPSSAIAGTSRLSAATAAAEVPAGSRRCWSRASTPAAVQVIIPGVGSSGSSSQASSSTRSPQQQPNISLVTSKL